MSFTNMSVTNRGRNLLAKAQSGATLNFTRLRVGSGSFSGNIAELTNLVTPVMWIELNQGKVAGDGKFLVGGYFTNEDITAGFYLRELGVYATDPNLGEILFCYANSGTGAEYIPNNTSSEIIERQLNVTTIVTNASSVTATINESLVFATTTALAEVQNQLSSHAGNADVHVTTTNKTNWNGKADALNPKLSGVVSVDNRYFSRYVGMKSTIVNSPNQRMNLVIPKIGFLGTLKVTVSGSYNSRNLTGKVSKEFNGSFSSTDISFQGTSQYSEASAANLTNGILDFVQIGEVTGDGTNYNIPIVYSDNGATHNLYVYVEGNATNSTPDVAFFNGMSLSNFVAGTGSLPKASQQIQRATFMETAGKAPFSVLSSTRVDGLNVELHSGWRIYNSLGEISSTLNNSSTMQAIFNAMADKSEIVFALGENNWQALGLPSIDYGIITITRLYDTRAMAEFASNINPANNRYGYFSGSPYTFQGWKKMAVADGTIQTNFNAEQLNGFTSNSFYRKPIIMGNDIDINTLSEPAEYYCPNNTVAETHTNLPVNSVNVGSKAYHLKVLTVADNERAQELTFFTPATEVWRRRRVAGSWSTWTKAVYQQDIYSQNGFGQTSGPFSNLAVTLNPAPTSYYVGLPVKIKLSVDISGNCNLNVNGLGSKPIYKNQISRLTRAKAGDILSLVYDGTNFILASGKGGELNVFAQATLPTDIFEGVCIKQNLPINKIVTDSTWFTGGSINANSSDYALYNSPEPTNVNSCVIGDNLYHSATNRNTIYAINKVTKANTLVTTVPTGLYIVAMISVGTDIYCTMKSTSYYNSGYLYKYSTITNSWTLLSSSIATSQYATHSMLHFNGNIYCSRTAYSEQASYDVYNLSTNTKTYVSDGLSDNSSWAAHSCCIVGEFLYMVLTISNGIVLQIKSMNTGTIVKTQVLTFPAGYDYYNTTNIKIVIESGKLYLVRADYNGLIVFDVPTNVATDFSTGTLVTISASSSTTAGFSDLCLFTNEIWIMNKGNDKDLIVRYMLNDKAYDTGTVVIKRTNQLSGTYQTQLLNNEDLTGSNNRLLTSFDDVAYYNGTSLQTGLPTYYGNGSSWVQFK